MKVNNLFSGVNYEEEVMVKCEVCVLGKYARLPFRDSQTKTSYILELIYSDVWGPIEQSSLQSSRYLEYNKSVVLQMFKEFKSMAETQTLKKINCNSAMKAFLRTAGIIH